MKQRILVAVIAIPILILAILFAPTWVLALITGAISAASAYELLNSVMPGFNMRRMIYVLVAALIIPLWTVFLDPGKVIAGVSFVLFVVLLCEMMLSFRGESVMGFGAVCVALVAGIVIPVLFTSIARLRELGTLYALLPFVAAFSSDSGAYFVGIFLGRNKLAPQLSPNKTIEGSVGGFLSAIIIMLLYGMLLKALGHTVDYAVLGVYGFFGSLACQIGDLGFSAIKRQAGVKDFGTVIPGHGGILDRFDGMLLTSATLELLAMFVPAIVITAAAAA